jgi:hypothetical protein
MEGDARRRFCQRCKLHVHDVSALSEEQIIALVNDRPEGVCARFFQRTDGTILTRDCPVGVVTLRRRVMTRLVTALAFCLAIVSSAIASAAPFPRGKGQLQRAVPKQTIEQQLAERRERFLRLRGARTTMGRIQTIKIIK